MTALLQSPPEPAPSECLAGVTPRAAGGFSNEVDAAALELRRAVGKLQLAYEGELHRTGSYTPPGAARPPDSPDPLRRARAKFTAAVKDLQRLVLGPPLADQPMPDSSRALRQRARALLVHVLTDSSDWAALETAVMAAAGLFVRAHIAEERPACPCMDRNDEGYLVHRAGCFYDPRLPTAEERTQDILQAWKVTERGRDNLRGDLDAALKQLNPLRVAAENVRSAWAKGTTDNDELTEALGALCALLPPKVRAAAGGAA